MKERSGALLVEFSFITWKVALPGNRFRAEVISSFGGVERKVDLDPVLPCLTMACLLRSKFYLFLSRARRRCLIISGENFSRFALAPLKARYDAPLPSPWTVYIRCCRISGFNLAMNSLINLESSVLLN